MPLPSLRLVNPNLGESLSDVLPEKLWQPSPGFLNSLLQRADEALQSHGEEARGDLECGFVQPALERTAG